MCTTASGSGSVPVMETYAHARTRLLSELRDLEWESTTYSRGKILKVPYATMPDKHTRVWFLPQAVHLGSVMGGQNNARSMNVDIRELPVAVFAEVARRLT